MKEGLLVEKPGQEHEDRKGKTMFDMLQKVSLTKTREKVTCP